MDEVLFDFYSTPQTGGSIPTVFVGSRRHLVGGSFFGTLARFALPILKKLGKHALTAVGRGAVEHLVNKKTLQEAMKDEFKQEGVGLIKEVLSPA